MDDLISRAALLELFVWKCCGECCSCEYEGKEKPYYCRLIKSAPAVDAVPVIHGQWMKPERSLWPMADCSVCGEMCIVANTANYCPNCGAKMNE